MAMKPVDISSLTFERIQQWFVDQGEKQFHGRQVFSWLHGRCATSFDLMTDLSKDLRGRLLKLAPLSPPMIVEEYGTCGDTMKFCFRLADGLEVEGVWIPEDKRRTLCVSTQVGCAMGCKFCATGTMGLFRNLTAGEIAGQLEAVVRRLRKPGLKRPVTNVVFMGMGEPLANLKATVDAVEIMLDDHGAGLSRRHVTVSTIGLISHMQEFVRLSPVKLAVSLNAATDEVRSRLMPINRRYPIAKLISACRDLSLRGKDRITFEYVLLDDINDSPDEAHQLARLLSGFPCKVNLIPYNPCDNLPYDRPDDERTARFQKILIDNQVTTFIRRSRGQSLQAACGQLVADRS